MILFLLFIKIGYLILYFPTCITEKVEQMFPTAGFEAFPWKYPAMSQKNPLTLWATRAKLALFILLCTALAATAETVVNWENGFEVDLPQTWLRADLKEDGLKLNSEDVSIAIEPYSGLTQDAQIERLHKMAKEDGYHFKSERSLTINQVPAHEMIFHKDGRYKIYYVLMAGSRGFLWTIRSSATDSEAFLEGQDILSSFRINPL
jgi:hypothetical protein